MTAILKVCILGEFAVGKTTLVKSFLGGIMTEEYKPTIGVDIGTKELNVTVKGKQTKAILQLWDLGGQQSLEKIRKNFYSRAVGGIAVYDITRPETLDAIPKWLDEFWGTVGTVPIVLVGNKKDLRDKGLGAVEPEQGEEMAKQIAGMSGFETPFIEASALRVENADTPFIKLVQYILEHDLVKEAK